MPYAFSIKVPEGAGAAAMGGIPRISLGPFSFDLGGGIGPTGPLQWFLEGYLDIPLGLDVRNKVQLNI